MNKEYTALNIIKFDQVNKVSFSVRRVLGIILAIIACILLVFLDYFVKEVKIHDSSSEIIKNSGITWGVGAEYSVSDVNRYIPFVVAILVFLLFYIMHSFVIYKEMNLKERYFWTFGGLLVLSGGIANLVDRIRLGYIVDYILIWRFPPLNLADLYIAIGICWLVALVILKERRRRSVFKFGI